MISVCRLISVSQGVAAAPPVPVVNGVLVENSKVKSNEESSVPCKVEKEEGELSPNADSEEDNFVAYGDSNAQSNQNDDRRKYESRNGEDEHRPEAGGDNDADADDEDSENVSEAGEDVSGSESAGDECSREDHEEEDMEHDDVDGKAESEGEAEGMCDADAQTGVDGSSLPLSERFLSTVKPLTKHVSAVSFVEDVKDSRVFYGNDDFFVLFRLHQVRMMLILFCLCRKNFLCVDVLCILYELGRFFMKGSYLQKKIQQALKLNGKQKMLVPQIFTQGTSCNYV